MKLSSSWCTSNTSRLLDHYYDNRIAAEVAMFVQFVFAQCGLHIQDFSVFREVSFLKDYFKCHFTQSSVSHSFNLLVFLLTKSSVLVFLLYFIFFSDPFITLVFCLRLVEISK